MNEDSLHKILYSIHVLANANWTQEPLITVYNNNASIILVFITWRFMINDKLFIASHQHLQGQIVSRILKIQLPNKLVLCSIYTFVVVTDTNIDIFI